MRFGPSAITFAVFVAAAGCTKDGSDDQPAARHQAPEPVNDVEVQQPAPKPSREQPLDIPWLTDEATARKQSTAQQRPLLIDFAAEWCAPCQDMEDRTFRDPALVALIRERFLALKVDVTEMSKDHEAVMKRHGVAQLPVILVLGADGKELMRWTDFVEAGPMRKTLERVSR
jgi:thiol:disulfide interchange protein